MSKFTPGPWRIELQEHESHVVVGTPYANLAVVMLGNCNDGSTGEANARLIAAAPDMLEALEAFMEMCAVPKQDIQAEKNAIAHAYELGGAAIRKARGI